jgi:ubiquinone/menaquinone biosynthesis C-methylase UbiE
MTGRRDRAGKSENTYHDLAGVYDAVYAWKNYAREARRVRAIVRRFGPPGAHRVLDVACGTGHHLEHLARWFDVVGLDSSGPMLRVARKRVPRVRFVEARMETFRLSERFDAIICLFSSIGYVRSRGSLERTLANFARHLRPGGVVLVEPWIRPSEFLTGSTHLGTYGTPQFPIVRMHLSERRGGRSIMEMHYLVGTKGGVRHWVERHDMGLFARNVYRVAFVKAGLRFIALPGPGFTGTRGLYLGVMPRAERARRGARGIRARSRSRGPRP